MINYESVLRHMVNPSPHCKEFADTLDRKIPDDSCDKGKLLAIVLAAEISSVHELKFFLDKQLDYHFGDPTPYERMLKAVKNNLDLNKN